MHQELRRKVVLGANSNTHWRFGAMLAVSSIGWQVACGPSAELACKPDPTTGSQWCQPSSSSGGDAVVTTGVAAGVYAVTGCTVNGCELPDQCNPQTKRCEPMRCNEAKPCPAGYSCQFDTNTCR